MSTARRSRVILSRNRLEPCPPTLTLKGLPKHSNQLIQQIHAFFFLSHSPGTCLSANFTLTI